MKKLSFKRANQQLRYDPETGNLYWIISHRGIFSGSVAGYFAPHNGYVQVGIDKKLYPAHRIAWLLMTRKWPKEIDHINGIKSDNRWCNLRECNRSQNIQNSKRHKNRKYNLSKGVHFASHVKIKPFYAQIFVNGKSEKLGYFKTAKEAAETYALRAKAAFGEFSRSDEIVLREMLKFKELDQ